MTDFAAIAPPGDGSAYEYDRALTLLRYPMETDGLLKRLQALLPETRPLGRDVSIYQGDYSVPAAAACGARFWYFRAGISWGAPDASFKKNYASAQGKPRTSYHVLYPDQPIIKQADQVWYAQHPEIDKVPRVIDLEVDRGMEPEQIGDRTWEMSELVKSRDDLRPLIYSRYLLINAWLASWTTAMLNDHFYLLAQYLYDRAVEHPGPPTIPNRVDPARVIWHQTADKKSGCSGEAESLAVDYNRWTRGDDANLTAFMLAEWGIGKPPPEPPPADCDPLPTLTVQVFKLNVRSGPGTNFSDVGDVFQGDKVTVYEVAVVSPSSVWVRIDPDKDNEKWCAAVHASVRYLK